MVTMKSAKSIIFLVVCLMCVGLFVSPVFASRDWVIDSNKHWNVERVCTDGAEILVVDFNSTTYSPDGYQHGLELLTTVEIELEAKAFLDDPEKYLDDDGNISYQEDNKSIADKIWDDYFYPPISSRQVISGSNSLTPLIVDAHNSGTPDTYYLYGQGILRDRKSVV